MTDQPSWTGDMLDDPVRVAAFSGQLRQTVNYYAEWVAGIRRDAEAMWRANPPEGYGSFERWYRERWVRGPLREIQEHLEAAAAATHALEARHRRGRHEIPERRLQDKAAKQARKQLPAATARRTPARPAARAPLPAERPPVDFMDAIKERSA